MVDGCKHGKVDQKVLWYAKTIYSLVKRLKVVAKCCFLLFFDDPLYYYAKYSNVEYTSSKLMLHYIVYLEKGNSSLLHEKHFKVYEPTRLLLTHHISPL